MVNNSAVVMYDPTGVFALVDGDPTTLPLDRLCQYVWIYDNKRSLVRPTVEPAVRLLCRAAAGQPFAPLLEQVFTNDQITDLNRLIKHV